jgi:predicted nuclease of predicted toxin-antitoxin system
MLLLEQNLPHQLRDLLGEFGVQAESTRYRGWETLRNGDLVSAATAAGFTAIVRRDRKFAESAAKALAGFPAMAVVIVRLDQRGWQSYREAFRIAWQKAPISPHAGRVTEWP